MPFLLVWEQENIGVDLMKKILIIPILLGVLVSGCIFQEAEIHSIEYDGLITHFRADLNKARLVPVYPGEGELRNLVFDEGLEIINITFIDIQKENGFYAVGSFELGYKLNLIKNAEDLDYVVNASIVTSREDLVPVDGMLYIFLAGPSLADETSVRLEDGVIVLSGRSFEEVNRRYGDLDLSIDKLLLILMEEG